MNLENSFKEWFLKNKTCYSQWVKKTNIDKRFSDIKHAYKESFGIQNVFDVDIEDDNSLATAIHQIKDNCARRKVVANKEFAVYSQKAEHEIPNAILNKHFVEFMIKYKENVSNFLEYNLSQEEQNRLIDEDIKAIDETASISDTEKETLILARKGQGKFRQKVIEIDRHCIITGVSIHCLLIASHIKPWRESTNIEKLDGNNGILLSPHIDKLFDSYFISFSDDGKILFFLEKIKDILNQWKIDTTKKYADFSVERKAYLKYHRKKCADRTKSFNTGLFSRMKYAVCV